MSHAVALEPILTRKMQFDGPDWGSMNVKAMKQAARFWFGTAAHKMNGDECRRALMGVVSDKNRVREKVAALSDEQKQILAIYRRYGGAVSGPLLRCEALARGLVEKPKDQSARYDYKWREKDPIFNLCDNLLLLSPHGGLSQYDHFYYSYSSHRHYPHLMVLPAVLEAVEPAEPLTWKATPPASAQATFLRAPAEVALDLATVAEVLAQAGSWKTNKSGVPEKSLLNRLQKLLLIPSDDPMTPPDAASLCYEVLRGLGAIHVEFDAGTSNGTIDPAVVERHLGQLGAAQARQWGRVWMQMRLWQDGIGAVPERYSDYNPVRIDPDKLATARELLAWALCRAAHGTHDWLDLETFLADLWSATAEEIDFYWHNYSWRPQFQSVKGKDNLPVGDARLRAYWLDDAGVWAANALMGTLAHLGLMERGEGGKDHRPCFRLTEIGRAVFGAPEIAPREAAAAAKFLTVQPNHEVLVYLDDADAGAVGPLVRMARRVSTAAGRVQTFALGRDSIYQALEGGMTVEEIRRFLEDHGKTALPANVAHSLAEWSRKREILAFHSDVTLGVAPAGRLEELPGAAKGRRLGEQFVLLPKTTARDKKCHVRDHRLPPGSDRPWEVDEEGVVRCVKEPDAVALARLAQFAEPTGDAWKITAESVRKARQRGILSYRILDWLMEHLAHPLPPIVETMLRNWTKETGVFLGQLSILQVSEPQAAAALRDSPRFQPFVAAHISHGWFVVHKEKLAELKRMLRELGFSMDGTMTPKTAPGTDGAERNLRGTKTGRRRKSARQIGTSPAE